MTKEDSLKVLSCIPSWQEANQTMKNEFIVEMMCCQLDGIELMSAWHWFRVGWIRSRRRKKKRSC